MRKLESNNFLDKTFYTVFGILPLLITLYIYPMISKKIPVHYWFDGTIDKWGSKNVLLVVPIIILLFIFFQPKIFKLNFNYEKEDSITKWSNYYFLILLNLLVYSTLYISLNYDTCLNHFNFYNFFTCSICFMFAFLGTYIPYCNRGSSISIRTKYTLKNEVIWSKTHRFCGFLWLSGSIVFFPMFLFASGYYLLIFLILMISTFILSPIIYTYYLFEKYLKYDLEKKSHFNKIRHSH